MQHATLLQPTMPVDSVTPQDIEAIVNDIDEAHRRLFDIYKCSAYRLVITPPRNRRCEASMWRSNDCSHLHVEVASKDDPYLTVIKGAYRDELRRYFDDFVTTPPDMTVEFDCDFRRNVGVADHREDLYLPAVIFRRRA